MPRNRGVGETRKIVELGGYWLTQIGQSSNYYIAWNDSAAGQRRVVSTGTSDLLLAEQKLAEHVVNKSRPKDADPADVPLSAVLLWYWNEHGQHLTSSDAAKRASALWTEFFGEANVADINRERIGAFIDWLHHDKGLKMKTVSRYLSTGRAALVRAQKYGRIRTIPFIPEVEVEPFHRFRMQPQQFAQMLGVIDAPHIKMFCMVGACTLARPENILDLRLDQIDWEDGLIRLNPPGRKQTKKYRPTVPICQTLKPWLDHARRHNKEYVVEYAGRCIKSVKRAFRTLRSRCDFPDTFTAKSIRHTMARELRRARVNPWEASVMLGHKKPAGASATTMIYAGDDPDDVGPDHCAEAATAIDAYFEKLQRLTNTPLEP